MRAGDVVILTKADPHESNTGYAQGGIAAAIGLAKAAQSLLFRLEGHDPVVLAVATVLLSAVALGAGYLPAHRASQVDPIKALRWE